jgi:hypothetical protein
MLRRRLSFSTKNSNNKKWKLRLKNRNYKNSRNKSKLTKIALISNLIQTNNAIQTANQKMNFSPKINPTHPPNQISSQIIWVSVQFTTPKILPHNHNIHSNSNGVLISNVILQCQHIVPLVLVLNYIIHMVHEVINFY